eukprot:1159491-Pelagomonas_calceolata.AAC.9
MRHCTAPSCAESKDVLLNHLVLCGPAPGGEVYSADTAQGGEVIHRKQLQQNCVLPSSSSRRPVCLIILLSSLLNRVFCRPPFLAGLRPHHSVRRALKQLGTGAPAVGPDGHHRWAYERSGPPVATSRMCRKDARLSVQ